MTRLEELWSIVSSIPRGKVAGYGDVGRAMKHPVSGVLIGKWMHQCPPDVPWWRVCGKNGDLLVGRKDPRVANLQADMLLQEGIELVDGRVGIEHFFVP
ncbi:MAG: MGMT family protein [Armatimonadetes bacterium]|nr:MGMT family protein [Armatimonadota bacterium]